MTLWIFLFEQTFESGEHLLESGFKPDILILDIIMNGCDGIQIGEIIKNHYVGTIIIYISVISDKVSEAINAIHSFGYLMSCQQDCIYIGQICGAVALLHFHGEDGQIQPLSGRICRKRFSYLSFYKIKIFNIIISYRRKSGLPVLEDCIPIGITFYQNKENAC